MTCRATDAASAERFWLRDKQGRFELQVAGIELPHGVRLTRSARGGVELWAQHASLADLRLHVPDLAAFRSDKPAPPPAEPAPAPEGLRQERLRFLDAIGGSLGLTIKVVLDLPVLGSRSWSRHADFDAPDAT